VNGVRILMESNPAERIKIAGGFASEDEIRIGHDRPRDGDSLLLSSGEPAWEVIRDPWRQSGAAE